MKLKPGMIVKIINDGKYTKIKFGLNSYMRKEIDQERLMIKFLYEYNNVVAIEFKQFEKFLARRMPSNWDLRDIIVIHNLNSLMTSFKRAEDTL